MEGGGFRHRGTERAALLLHLAQVFAPLRSHLLDGLIAPLVAVGRNLRPDGGDNRLPIAFRSIRIPTPLHLVQLGPIPAARRPTQFFRFRVGLPKRREEKS